MKATAIGAFALTFVLGSSVMAAEISSFCPQSWNSVGTDGNGVLKIWGIPKTNGKPLMAVPNDTWPRFSVVATWRDAIINAKVYGTCVKIYYDSTIFTDTNPGVSGYKIWEIVE